MSIEIVVVWIEMFVQRWKYRKLKVSEMLSN
jgi:hypothetical protein